MRADSDSYPFSLITILIVRMKMQIIRRVHVQGKHLFLFLFCPCSLKGLEAPVAQWVKPWPTDLAVPGSRPAEDETFSTENGTLLHTAFLYHPSIVLV